MGKNMFTQLKADYCGLTKVEKRIADVILQNPARFITLSITGLSEIAAVSQGSINNFAKKYADGGYAALKLKIAGCMSEQQEMPFSIADKSGGVLNTVERKLDEMAITFRNTWHVNDETVLQRVAQRILCAKRIILFGIFNSSMVANDFCYQLIQLGIPATHSSDTLIGAVSASMLDADGLIIAVSSTGRTKEVLDAIAPAKRKGVPVVALTANRHSPLAKMADDVLLCAASDLSISDHANEIRMAQLFLVDALCSYLRSLIDENGHEHYFRLQEILESHSVRD